MGSQNDDMTQVVAGKLHVVLGLGFMAVFSSSTRSVRVAERLALPTLDHGVAGSNPAGGEILPEPIRRFIAQSLSCPPSHRLEITEILLKGRKTLTHQSIFLHPSYTHWVNPEYCSNFIGIIGIILPLATTECHSRVSERWEYRR